MLSRTGIGRAIEFGRHVPITRLGRRLELMVRRGVRDRWPALASDSPRPAPPARPAPPLPLMPPHPARLSVGDRHLALVLLNRTIDVRSASGPGLVNWRVDESVPTLQLWRMHLHAMEYLDQVPDRLWADLVSDWIAANSRPRPGDWKDAWNTCTVAIRTVAWMQGLALRQSRIEAGIAEAIRGSIAHQLRFLERHLETDIGGNHLIKNIRALIWGSRFFTGLEADRWRELGLALLREELPRQILADGMHYERSASYHCQVFADLIECRQALGHDPFGGNLDAALAEMAQAAADLIHPDGGVALFNDAGMTMAHAPAACLAAFAALTGARPKQRRVFALDAAGYFGLRSGGTFLLVDCGRIAPDDLPAHGHGDILSFELSVGGERVIVDQGVYEYTAGPRRQAARRAASHNTLAFERAEQADFFGAFRCGRRPDVTVRQWQADDDGFVLEGSHNGYSHLPGAPVHVRKFDVRPDRILIRDRIEGAPRSAASVSFLLHPNAEVGVDGSEALIRRGCGHVRLTATRPISVEDAVWWPDLGREEPTRRLVIRLMPSDHALTTALHLSCRGSEGGGAS